MQEPLPSVQHMSREELDECLAWVTAALPCLEVELYDNGSPGDPRIFKAPSQPVQEEPSGSKKSRSKKKDKDKKAAPAPEVYSVTLIYLSVVGELHVERSPRKPLDLQRRLVCALRHGTFGFSGHFTLGGYLEISELTNVLRCTRGELHQAVQLDSGNSKRRVDDSRQGYLHAFQGHSSDCGHELAYMNPPLTSQEIKEISWPDCTSRRNVLQEGQTSVQAFCLGLAKAYFAPEMRLSRGTQVLPQLGGKR
eukprot:s163_g30.t1